MNPLLEAKCKRLLFKYKQTGHQSFRDKLFELSSGYVVRYVKLCLKRYKKYESQTQVLSLAYEVFNTAVETYSKVSCRELPMHISNCAKAEIKKHIKRERKHLKRNVSIEEESIFPDTIAGLSVNPFYAVEGYISLKDFRSFLPDAYKTILDDAICSFDNTRKYRQTKPVNCPLSSHRYYEAKRIFQFVAEFFLKG